ncbi:MAG: rod shape-determining protein MreC [Candidatus Acidiferrales bacterium]
MMIESISRLRPMMLLAIVVLAQVLLLAFQIKGEHNVPLIRYWAAAIVTPLERGGTWTFSSFGNIWKGYVGLRNARAENESMHAEMERLQLRNQELESQNAEAQRLKSLLNFHDAHPETEMLAAEVIGSSSDPSSHTLFINRGEKDRIRMNYAVITPDGIIGKIVEVFPRSAQVQLINDPNSGVGALFSATRTHGVVRGTGEPDPHMEYVIDEEKVQKGELVVTSGEDKIFPKDLLIGTVAAAQPGTPFQTITIAPAARLDRLEDVLVLLSQHDFEPKKSDNVTGAEAKAAQAAADAAAAPAATPTKSAAPANDSNSGAPSHAPAAAANGLPKAASAQQPTTPDR